MSQPSRHLLGQRIPLALIGLGALLALGAIFADEIGFSGGGDGFGWKQLIATIVGLIIALFGVSLLMRPSGSRELGEQASRRAGEQKE